MTFSVDLCQNWQRIGQLQDTSFTFEGVERHRESGEWSLTFPYSAPSWTSRPVPVSGLLNFLTLDGASWASTPDAAAHDITGDIDIRWFGTLTSWANGDQTLISKWSDAGGQKSYLVLCEATGVRLYISTTGVDYWPSAAFPVPAFNGAYIGIRFTRVQATGLTTCYFSTDGTNWTADPTTTVLSAGSAIFASSANVIIGTYNAGALRFATGRCRWAEIRNGIAGTVVTSPNFSYVPAGQSLTLNPYTDPQGYVWTGAGAGAVIGTDDGPPIAYTSWDVDTIRLLEDGVVRFAGYVGEAATGSGGIEYFLDSTGSHWTMSGPDLWDMLRTKVAFPDPAVPQPWAVDHDVNTAVASTALAAYISDNAGASAVAARVVPNFSVVDGLVGAAGTWSARLQPLYELAVRILADADLTIRWTVTATNITASIVQARDLSETVVLSDQADLVSVRIRLIPARSTYVLAGGTGDGVARIFRDANSGATGLARRERFVDVSSLNQASEVQAVATTNQRLDAGTWAVTAEVADAVTNAIGFGRTVFVGDKITVQTAGQQFVVPVKSIRWSITPERQVVRPILGEGVPDALKGLLRDVANLAGRFDNAIA